MVEYRPSADRAEYAAQSEEERRRTRERQRRDDGSFYGDGDPNRPAVEIVDRDITQWRDAIEARQGQSVSDQITNPLGLPTPGATPDDTTGFGPSGTVDLEASWSDRRWVLYDEARQDAETADPSEFYAWLSRDRTPGARGEEDTARFEGMNQALARETIDDWKARLRRAEEYGAATVLGSATRRDPANPVAERATGPSKAQQFVDPQTGRVVSVNTSGFKAVPTPTASELADQLKATGQDDLVFIGFEGKYGGGQGVVAPTLMSKEALRYFDNFPPEMQDRVMEITRLYYEGMDPQFSWNEKRWNEAVDIAHSALYNNGVYKSPFEAYEQVLIRWRAQEEEKNRTSGGGGGGFYGGGGSASTKRITLTSVTDAYYLLNQAMGTYLGRSPSQQELARFVKMLNAQETANPVVATATGDTTMQEGGFNPAVFAEQFARGTEGSAEYQAATTFLDTLMGALDGQTGVI